MSQIRHSLDGANEAQDHPNRLNAPKIDRPPGNPSSVFRILSSVFCLLRPSTSVENPLQINLFMQNKPNFRKSQMNLKFCNKMAYENIANWTIGQNKPNSNPIKPNLQKAKMNVNLTLTKDYRKNDCLASQKTNPIQTQFRKAKIACRKIRPHLYFLRNHLLLVLSGDLGYIIKLGFIREVKNNE